MQQIFAKRASTHKQLPIQNKQLTVIVNDSSVSIVDFEQVNVWWVRGLAAALPKYAFHWWKLC